MALIQKQVAVPESVETIIKSAVDLARTVKGGGDFNVLLGDLVADIQASQTVLADMKICIFATARSVTLGLIDIAQVVLS